MKKTIWRVSYDSRNFTFEAFGLSEQEARDAFAIGIAKHASQWHSALDWPQEANDGAECHSFDIGACYRDRERISL